MTHAGGIACDCAECFVASTLERATGPVAEVLRAPLRDDGADSETRLPKPCSARLPNGGWCLLLPHPPEVAHIGLSNEKPHVAPDFGPGRKR